VEIDPIYGIDLLDFLAIDPINGIKFCAQEPEKYPKNGIE
jgi:hypothetical protein